MKTPLTFFLERGQFLTEGGRSRTSGLTTLSGSPGHAEHSLGHGPPVARQTSEVEADQWGVRITLSRPISGSSRGSGSISNTSSPAPAIRAPQGLGQRPWSTSSPRATLMKYAVGFIKASSLAPISPRVASVSRHAG